MRAQAWRAAAAALALAAAGSAAEASCGADTLARIRDDGRLEIGYRRDAAPFSSGLEQAPRGYTVALCRHVARDLAATLGRPVTPRFRPVDAAGRFEALRRCRIDLLCGATTVTLERRRDEAVEFSVLTFAESGGAAYRRDNPVSFEDMTDLPAGAVAGTTAAQGLAQAVAERRIGVRPVVFESYDAAIGALASGAVRIVFGDRTILAGKLDALGRPDLVLSERSLSFEPYALALRRGDHDFRAAVDAALGRLYASPEIDRILKDELGLARRPDTLALLYRLMTLPRE